MVLGKGLRLILLAIVGVMAFPAIASATWPGTNGKIYFSCRATGTGFAGQDICVINADGSGFANLTNTPALTENTPDVSRDGSRVTFTRSSPSGYFGWVMNADGSDQHQVTPEEADGPAFTPDGQISYRAKLSASYEFKTVSAAGGGASTTLLSAGVTGNAFAPRWSTNGTYLYGKLAQIPATTNYSQQIYTVGPGGETEITHAASGLNSNQQPSWSPDGSKILFWRSTGVADDIWVISSSGGVDSMVTNTGSATLKKSMPSFSPDGNNLAWDQYVTTDPANDFFHKFLVVANADGSNPLPIPRPSAIDYAATPVWSPVESAAIPQPTSSFDATAEKKVRKGKPVSVKLRCTGDTPCVVTYSAAVTVPVKGKKPKKFKIKAKTVTIAGKASKTVKLTLPSSAKKPISKALKAGKKPSLKISASARQPNNGPLIRKLLLGVRITK